MPLLQFDVIEGRSEAELQKMLHVAHAVVLQAFGVPDRDRYQIVHENKRTHMVFEDTGLGLERTDKLVVVRVYTSPREEEQKHFFMAELCREFEKHCGIGGNDLMVVFIVNEKSDWSFGNGEAQYVTGRL